MNTRLGLFLVLTACVAGCASGPPLQVAAPTNAHDDDTVAAADKSTSIFSQTSADVSKVGSDMGTMYNDASDAVSSYWQTASAAWDKASDKAAHYRMITSTEFAHLSSVAEKCYAIARDSVPPSEQSVASLQAIAEGCYAQAHNPRQQ